MMLQRLLFSVVLAIFSLALSLDSVADPKTLELVTYPVRLHPEADKNKNEKPITAEVEEEKKCKQLRHDGCMLFTSDTVGDIEFYLTGSPKKTSCSDLPSTSAKRVITKIELSTTQQQNDHTKGVFGDPVESWLKELAFPGVNPDNGILYHETAQTGRTAVTVRNENKHPYQKDLTKSFWYQVTVTDCDDPRKQWVFDPRGDNEGLK